MNYSDVRRWWSTLNDRGFICPVEKWSIVWSNWPIEYFWVFLIFFSISEYIWGFLNIFQLSRGEEIHIVRPSWPITSFSRQHHHWPLIWIQAPLLDPFSLQHLRKFRMAWNGPSWCIWDGNLSNLHPKVVGYQEFYTVEISWWNCHPMQMCNFQRDLYSMRNLSLHRLILWNRLLFLIEEADLKFVKKFIWPNFRANEFYTLLILKKLCKFFNSYEESLH